ncbi:MAG: hypothetical protein QF362_01770 [Candidatus Woesearchaeota archaeon]|jgi:Ni,Fe-hydrogenase maturation factor|nr:hypothetical protein [Candidatus Woesearchaeota archaeon]MDP7506151.1 hypothetical protein [Candidatus Woesearchaeota archaeon]MDP7610351.1 hypothetical protein [Candidatus Woesearchaeota archaeon]|tara:strand:+ start:589 stop:966 length:378 start_codon:yes stop_codon:yes gene_type:complete
MKYLILTFGNEFHKENNPAIKLSEELEIEGFDSMRCYDPGDLFKFQNYETIYIVEVVKDIEKVEVIKDIETLKKQRVYSMHDINIDFFVKSLKELGELKELVIIGIPLECDIEEIKKEIVEIVKR